MIFGRRYLLVFLMVIVLVGCGDYQEPQFDKINELKVHDIDKDYITLKGKALFKNPDKLSYKVKKLILQLFIRKKQLPI